MKYQYFMVFGSLFLFATLVSIIVGFYALGSLLSAPRPMHIGNPPDNLVQAESVHFNSALGNTLRGWYAAGQPQQGAILLTHGLGGNRWQMLSRAAFLNQAGYTVLLIDLQAHGESMGEQITFGYRESYDVAAAYAYLSHRHPQEPIAMLGMSLGGAAIVLSSVAAQTDALVLEAVYSTLEAAVANRIVLRLGEWGRYLTPLLTWQVKPRTGVSAAWLRPIDRLAAIQTPVLFIAGETDKHTLLSESKRLYQRANPPKQLWVVAEAGHDDFHAYTPQQYETRVLAFLAQHLSRRQMNEQR